MEATQGISQIEPDVLMAIGLYREKSSEITDALHALMKELGDYKVDAKYAREIMDRYIPKTGKHSEEIDLMREE